MIPLARWKGVEILCGIRTVAPQIPRMITVVLFGMFNPPPRVGERVAVVEEPKPIAAMTRMIASRRLLSRISLTSITIRSKQQNEV